ncbi:OST-HTH associated domain-containing protein, putative [Babesia ovata]|uniref:OST-HTH associated domain-containing protein, putative n=1 Tax=Babesia ovata TaxID=189622 RepID=A0A2H6KFT5_9APIC|nr:OST-HTH associated domain-containing protein, putative [Babesia ovata]GBE61863.1 OST-HTH associated domain-containing protein, putative [Babesia ovata]
MKTDMSAYRKPGYESQMLNRQVTSRKALYGGDGKYSQLMSSISTIVDEDEQSLLSAVLETFSGSAREGTNNSDQYSDSNFAGGYAQKPILDSVPSNEPFAELYPADSFPLCDPVCQGDEGFRWSLSSPSSCFGTEKAQLYERLFDSYITLFNAEDSAVDVPAPADASRVGDKPVSPSWEAMEALRGFDGLSISERPAVGGPRESRRKAEPTNVVDKSKSLWKRKRSKFKTLEKRAIPPLTGVDFQEAMEFLKQIVESLYRDQMPPTFFNVRSRFVEFDTKNIPVEHIMNICQRRPDVFRVETNDALNQTYIYFVKPPSYFTKWIDRNDLTDVYPEEMWDKFLDFLVELVNNPDHVMPVFPGSIYGTAKVFQKLELEFFEGMTLGVLCHVVQLAVRVRKLLMYELKTLKPNLLAILQACIKRSK